jgi:hypothetical protein
LTLLALIRVAYARGRAARITDTRRGSVPSVANECRVLMGCIWHTARYRCAQGPIMASHSAGRLCQSLMASPRIARFSAAGRPQQPQRS